MSSSSGPFPRGQMYMVDPAHLYKHTGDISMRSRRSSERLLDPRLVLCLNLPQAGSRKILRLVVDLLVVDPTQQDQVLIAVNHVSRAFAIARTTWGARCDVSLVADNRIVIGRRLFRDKDPTAQRTPVT